MVKDIERDKADIDRAKDVRQRDNAKLLREKESGAGASDLKKYTDAIAKTDATIKELNARLAAHEASLRTCLLRCAARKGVLPPLPPEIPIAPHPEPHAVCPQCEKYALRAAEKLKYLAADEVLYLSYRHGAFRLHAWLSAHTNEIDSDSYFVAYRDYADHLAVMSAAGGRLKEEQEDFDRAMDSLARCNAVTKCEESSAVTLGPQPILGPASAEVKAACAACEGEALAVKEALAIVQWEKARFLADTAERAELVAEGGKRPLSDAEFVHIKALERLMKRDQESVAQAEKRVEEARAALDLCNKNCPPPATTPPQGGTQPVASPQPPVTTPQPPVTPPPTGTDKSVAPGATPVAPQPVTPLPAAPGATPPPPSGATPPQPPVPGGTGMLPGAPAPWPQPGEFGLSGGLGVVTDKPPSIGVFPVSDSPLLHGPTHINTASATLWLPGSLWEFGGMYGHATTSTQVPVGTQSGWAYWTPAPNGFTGVSTPLGADASLKTTYSAFNLNWAVPYRLKEDPLATYWGVPMLGYQYSETKYDGMISAMLIPGISSTTNQKVKESNLRGGYGVRGQYTASNQVWVAGGIGLDAIYYWGNYNGSQDNACAVCTPGDQSYSVSNSGSKSGLTFGARADAAVGFPVSKEVDIFVLGTYRYDHAVLTLVNNVTPTDPAPHLSTGDRNWARIEFGVRVKFNAP